MWGGAEAYLHHIDDYTIPHEMFVSGQTWAVEQMQLFFRLTRKFYGIMPQKGDYFFDIGANIGTTSIWVSKNVRPKLHVISFEPNPATWRMLEVNRVLNACTDMATENIALSDSEGDREMITFSENSGRNQIVTDVNRDMYGQEHSVTMVRTMRLDDYLQEKQIDPERIQYIWIDTEGYEPFVIAGMKNLLQKKKIPLFMEFSYDVMDNRMFELLYHSLEPVYRRFVAVGADSGRKQVLDLKELPRLFYHAKEQYDLFLF